MSSDSASPGLASKEQVAILDATPVMGELDVSRAKELSMAQVTPPLQVPGYEQEQFLGRGAYGEVWKAVNSNSGRIVAIKFYNRRGGLDWSHMSREVEKLQYLFSDRYVVQLFDVGWDANPPYYVMEYMKYGSLEDRLQAGPISIADAVSMIRQIAVGLVHAHDRGILHCDLKPENILLDDEGHPRLADFGQSRLKHEHAPAVGTLFYMAPEQAELSVVPDVRWDVYALGAILYRMVTGKLPYLTAESSQSLASQESVDKRLQTYSQLLQRSEFSLEHDQVAGVDPALREIIDRCLAINPKHRYPNVQSVLHALALRESKQAQRPLLILGIAGPGMAVLLLSLGSLFLFNRTLQTARDNLLERTYESDQFAAKSVASQFAMEIERRWQALMREAQTGPLPAFLQQDPAQQNLKATPSGISQWLNERYTYWNTQFGEQTKASYWYVLDRNGVLRGVTPAGEELVGTYFGYRDYFHGQGHQLAPDGQVPKPIQQSCRSNVFRSQPNNRLAVSLSVPISAPNDPTQVLGVLVMESDLGHFAEFQGSRNQAAVLIDTRPDDSGRRGSIVEHPQLNANRESNQRTHEFYVETSTLAELDAIRQKKQDRLNGDEKTQANRASAPTILHSYHDPVAGFEGDPLIAVVEPISFRQEGVPFRESGWFLLVQENQTQTLEPISQLRSMVIRGSTAALVVVVLALAGLWGLVVYIQNAPQRLRASQIWSGHLSGGTSSSSSRDE